MVSKKILLRLPGIHYRKLQCWRRTRGKKELEYETRSIIPSKGAGNSA